MDPVPDEGGLGLNQRQLLEMIREETSGKDLTLGVILAIANKRFPKDITDATDISQKLSGLRSWKEVSSRLGPNGRILWSVVDQKTPTRNRIAERKAYPARLLSPSRERERSA